jgi:hypothetical protein
MRNISVATLQALVDAPSKGIVPRKLFWATVKDRDTGDPVSFGFWSGDYTVSIDVLSGTTGLPVTRTYIGGCNLEVGEIARVSDLTSQPVTVSLSALPIVTQQLVRQYDARFARVEIHTALLSTVSRLPVDEPEIEMIGQIDGAPIETGAAGGESVITMTIRDDALLMLTRKNPRKRSNEGQKRRKDDGWGKYSAVAGTWRIVWGE